jgi:hypothetical protein
MNKQMISAVCLALIATLPGSPAFGRQGAAPVSIFATIGHSEWCPAGTVRLDLGTGRYTMRAPARQGSCHRPFLHRIRMAVLPVEDLARLQAAYARAAAEGLMNPACRTGGQPREVVISNGGTPVMRLTERGRTTSPPGETLTCWSEAAMQLHDTLEIIFHPRDEQPYRR